MSGWKDWQIGEVVEASDFQSYVQDQTVQVYAGTAVRASTLGNSVSEGMVSYTTDDNQLSVYTGSAWNTVSQVQSPNYIINGAFDFWQRGTSFTPTAAAFSYTADRWDTARATGTSGATVTRQSSGLTGFEYALRYQRNSGDTSTASLYSIYRLESAQSIPLAGQTVTFSFYARAGANYSASSSALLLSTYSGTGTNQGGYPSTWTGSTTLSSPTFTLTTSWQRFTTTYTIGSSATQLGFLFTFNPTGTASTNDWFEITGVQLEAGSVATPFRRAANTLQGELAACQRYYYRATPSAAFGLLSPFGAASSTTSVNLGFVLPVEMRVTPTSVDFSTLQVYDAPGAGAAVTAVALSGNGMSRTIANIDLTASGLTANRPYALRANNSTSAFIGFSAEL